MKATEKYSAFCGTVCFGAQSGSYFWVRGWLRPQRFKWIVDDSKCDDSNETYWAVLSCGTVFMLYNVVVTFESVDEILKCDHSNLTAIDTWNKTHVIWRTFYNLERPLHLHRWKPLILRRRQVFISSGGGLPRSLRKSDFTVQVACRETINPLHLELFELNYRWKWKTMCLNQKSVLWILYT